MAANTNSTAFRPAPLSRNPKAPPNQPLEVAVLNVRPGRSAAFEQAFQRAQAIISSMPGYISYRLQRCIEVGDKYLLLVEWDALEDHIVGCRESPQYREWKRLLHYFYDPFPTVEHYEAVFSGEMEQ